MAQTDRTYLARCYACGHDMEVSPRAVTVRCPKCTKGLNLDDIIVQKGFSGAKAQTCGTVQVRRKARLMASAVEASAGVQVLGALEGNVVTAGPMHIGPYGKFKGNCKAQTLIVDYGARIEGGYFEISGAAAQNDNATPELEAAATR